MNVWTSEPLLHQFSFHPVSCKSSSQLRNRITLKCEGGTVFTWLILWHFFNSGCRPRLHQMAEWFPRIPSRSYTDRTTVGIGSEMTGLIISHMRLSQKIYHVTAAEVKWAYENCDSLSISITISKRAIMCAALKPNLPANMSSNRSTVSLISQLCSANVCKRGPAQPWWAVAAMEMRKRESCGCDGQLGNENVAPLEHSCVSNITVNPMNQNQVRNAGFRYRVSWINDFLLDLVRTEEEEDGAAREERVDWHRCVTLREENHLGVWVCRCMALSGALSSSTISGKVVPELNHDVITPNATGITYLIQNG